MISFSDAGIAALTDAIQIVPFSLRQQWLEHIGIFGYNGKHDRQKAVGQCDFTNPENRPSRVVCRAITTRGVFEAEFVTDGTPPRVTRMTPG